MIELQEIKKIVVFRALQIGDMLCSIPAIRALRHRFPDAEITLVGLPWAKMLIDRFPQYFDKLVTFPGYPGFPEQPVKRQAFPSFLEHIQQQQFDLAIQMQGSGSLSNPLVDLFAAKYIAGFYTPGNFCPNPDLFIPYPADLHEVNRHLKLMEVLGFTGASTDLEFPVTIQDEQALVASELPIQKEYVVIHPGARGLNRQWDTANFAAVGDFCVQNGFDVVITGTAEELDIVERVIQQMRYVPVNAAGKTSLGAVAALIKNAAALISNCTGVSHIAAGLKTRSIVISLDGEPYRWGPLNKSLHKTIDWTVTQDLDLVKSGLAQLLSIKS